MQLFSKDELIEQLIKISAKGFIKSIKKAGNDGAVGNTLERLLGIAENNLPIPNAVDWELKGQRESTNSLITLKHIEPSPQGAKIVSSLLLPYYGWQHQQAGLKYSENEMSFRSTTSANKFTNRGFTLKVDRNEQKIKFIFDHYQVDISNPEIKNWLDSVHQRIGLNPLEPEPYWGFQDLEYAIGEKIKNCFYVIAENKKENNHEYFWYKELYILSSFCFAKFLDCLESGLVLIDFDARTGHNHGTKFRIRQKSWTEIYNAVQFISLD